MPRDGAGTYNAPEAAVVTGTPISSTSYNASLADLGTALTGSVARDGQSPMTAALPMGNNRITGMANGVATTDAAAVGQVVLTSGANPMAAALPMGGNKITGLADGTATTDAAAFGQITPRPTASAGIGQLVPIAVTGAAVSLSLPAGGTWAYFAWQSIAGAADQFNVTGVAAGGTVILGPSNGTLIGFAWRQT